MYKTIKELKTFFFIWKGQVCSVFGSQMMGFALSIWIYEQTSSVQLFSFVLAAQLLPALILTPFIGVLVDRFSRRKLMIVSEILVLASLLLQFYLAVQGQLTYNWVISLTPIVAILTTIHTLAYLASIPLIVPEESYEQATTWSQIWINLIAIATPALSVILLDGLGIEALFLINCFCYVISITTLMRAKFNDVKAQTDASEKPASNWKKDLMFGFHYIKNRKILKLLLLTSCCFTFLHFTVHVLFRPFLLMDYDNSTVGLIVTIAGVGGLVGAFVPSFVKEGVDKFNVLLSAAAVCCLCLCLVVLMPNFAMIAVLTFIFAVAVPVIFITLKVLWLQATPADDIGKVYSTSEFFNGLAEFTAVAVSPILVTSLIHPLLLSSGHVVANEESNMPIQLLFLSIGAIILLLLLIIAKRFNSFKNSDEYQAEQSVEATEPS